MFPQVLEGEDYADPRQYSNNEAQNAMSSYRPDWRVTGCGIEESAVQKHGRLILVEGEPTV